MRGRHKKCDVAKRENGLGLNLYSCGTPIFNLCSSETMYVSMDAKRKTSESVRHTNHVKLVFTKPLKHHTLYRRRFLGSIKWKQIVLVVCQQWLVYKMGLGYFQTPCLSGLVRCSLKGHKSVKSCLFLFLHTVQKINCCWFYFQDIPSCHEIFWSFFLSFYSFFFLHSRSKPELLITSVYLLATHSATLHFHRMVKGKTAFCKSPFVASRYIALLLNNE